MLSTEPGTGEPAGSRGCFTTPQSCCLLARLAQAVPAPPFPGGWSCIQHTAVKPAENQNSSFLIPPSKFRTLLEENWEWKGKVHVTKCIGFRPASCFSVPESSRRSVPCPFLPGRFRRLPYVFFGNCVATILKIPPSTHVIIFWTQGKTLHMAKAWLGLAGSSLDLL